MHTPRLDALMETIAANPQRWRMLRRPPEPSAVFDCEPDGMGGEWITLTPASLETLGGEIDCLIGEHHNWLHRGGRNFIDAPTPADQAQLGKHLFVSATHLPFGFGQYLRPLADRYLMSMWMARQVGIIDADEWGACFMAGWCNQPGSVHMNFELSKAETSAMFDALGEAGGFYWNKTIKCRADLPETVRLCRGIAGSAKPEMFGGYSWTDSSGTGAGYALQRADQLKAAPMVIYATFSRDDIAAVIEHQFDAGRESYNYREWLIKPNVTPSDVDVFAVRFNLFKAAHELQRVT